MELGFECLSKGDLHLLKPTESVRLARRAVGTTKSFRDADLCVPALRWCVTSGFPLGRKALVLVLVPVTYILVPSLLGVHGGVGGGGWMSLLFFISQVKVNILKNTGYILRRVCTCSGVRLSEVLVVSVLSWTGVKTRPQCWKLTVGLA